MLYKICSQEKFPDRRVSIFTSEFNLFTSVYILPGLCQGKLAAIVFKNMIELCERLKVFSSVKRTKMQLGVSDFLGF